MDLTRFLKAPKNKNELSFFKRKYYNSIIRLVRVYNTGLRTLRGGPVPSGSPDLDDIRSKAHARSDISDHLETLYVHALQSRPKLIVELGVGPGQSTFVLERVAKQTGARWVSIDINDRTAASSWEGWTFIREDDVSFAQRFPQWASEQGIEPRIDVLFIDTSHTYDHTVREIQAWFPFLAGSAKVFFHDTNAVPLYWHRDGGIGIGYDIKRGVIAALENFFKSDLSEKRDFTDIRNGWLIQHHASCNGFTILTKLT